VTEINKVFNKNLALTTLFQAPTIEQLANILRQSEWSTPSSSLVPIQPDGSKSPLFVIHILGKGLEPYRNIARYLGSDQPTLGLVYGLGTHIEDRKQTPFTRVEDLADHYIQEMRTVQPEGPYLLAGLSFGGIVAYEMARQLHEQGQKVALLALFDTHSPTVSTKVLDSTSFQIHLRNLSKIRLQERFAYILQKVKYTIQENMPGWIKRWFLKMRAEFYLRTGRPMPYELHLSLHIEGNKKLAQGYVLQVYPGRITLFRANEQSVKYEHSSDLGWSKLAAGGVEIYEVPGDHLGIFEEPNNRVLAEKLKACLDKVQADISEDQTTNLLVWEFETPAIS
jgi:aspartate racemase